MSVVERPHGYCFSKNDIRYVFQLNNIDIRPGLYLQVRLLYTTIGDDTFAELYLFDGLKPGPDGKVYLYMQAYLDSVVNFVITAGDNVTNAEDQARQFYIEWREVEDADVDPAWETAESDHVRIVLKGGIERHKNRRNNFFINYLFPEKKFLTWFPENRFCYASEPLIFSFINVLDGVAQTGSKMKVVYTYQDGTTSTSILSFTIDPLIAHVLPILPIDPALDNKIVSVDISIVTNDELQIIINPYRLYIEYRPIYVYYDLLYFNSLGGTGWVRVVGNADISYDLTANQASGGYNVNDWTNYAKAPENFVSSMLLQKKFSGDIGYLRTKDMQEAFLDIFTNLGMFMPIGNGWVQVMALQRSQKLGTRKDDMQSFPIEWQLCETNEVFTPEDASFGDGEDTEVYA
jgi:hypothetical protein